jgi:hypothetical protein
MTDKSGTNASEIGLSDSVLAAVDDTSDNFHHTEACEIYG